MFETDPHLRTHDPLQTRLLPQLRQRPDGRGQVLALRGQGDAGGARGSRGHLHVLARRLALRQQRLPTDLLVTARPAGSHPAQTRQSCRGVLFEFGSVDLGRPECPRGNIGAAERGRHPGGNGRFGEREQNA